MFDLISNKLDNLAIADVSSMSLLLAQAQKAEATGIYKYVSHGALMLLALLAVVALAIFLGNFIARSIRMADYGTRLAVIFGSIFISLLLLADNKFTPRFGIDLQGGMNMIGSLNVTEEEDDGMTPDRTTTTPDQIIPILLRRVDPSGLLEIMIRPLGTDKIEVTIPGSKAEADEIWSRLIKTGKLQFLIMNENRFSKHKAASVMATELAKSGNLSRNVGQITETFEGREIKKPLAKWFSLAREDDKGQTIVAFKMVPERSQLLRDSRTGRLVDPAAIPTSSRDNDIVAEEFTVWWEKNFEGTPQILLMEPEQESMRVEGKHLNANQLKIGMDEFARDSVNFEMTADGSSRMFNFTWPHRPGTEGEYRMAIVLDNQVHSAPALQSALSNNGTITGNFSREEVDDLIISLRSGNIDVALNDNPISSQFIESELGQELKEKGLIAIGASLVIVLVFIMYYYRFAGIVAAGALLLNLLFTMAIIMAIQQPLTMTGLAGLVLTVGMAVDANVLIYERIREELDKGAALRMAIRNGFDKAWTTIVDSNVTTLITAIVLYVIGTEQIKGFAVTLILGILMSMFTAIYCARTVFDICERKRWLTQFNMMRMFRKAEFDFVSKRFWFGVPSVILIGIGIAAMFGLKDRILNQDFRGGSTVRAVFKEPPGEIGGAVEGRDVILKALEAEQLEYDGQSIEFAVSSVSSKLENEFKDRIYVIDSNVRAFDGEGQAPYEELAPLIARVFKDRLELLHVSVNGESSDENQPADQPNDTDTGHWLNAPGIISAMNLHRPNVILTPAPAPSLQDAQDDPPATDASGSDDPLSVDEQDTDNADSASAAEAEAGDSDPQSASDSSSLQAGDTAESADTQLAETVTKLEFKFPVSGREVRTFIVAAAERVDLEIDSDQIDLQSPDATGESVINSLMSSNWTVNMKLPSAGEAAKIFDNLRAEYNARPYFPTTSSVGGRIARDTQIQALVAIFASMLGIVAYVWIRFQNVAFGLAAVVALVHDVMMVLGAIAVSHYVSGSLGFLLIEDFKISLPIVAALLTLIGYSLNDTIVIFDRIREVRGKRTELNAEIINTSVCQTLSRTILTCLTTFMVVFILYCFGGEAIHGFAFSLVIGIIVGTYSSVFIAAPVLLWLMNSVGLNPGEPINADTEPA